jgi:sugar/nucleoside kinase (ribokinase family)
VSTAASPEIVTFGETMALLIATEPGPLEQVEQWIKRTAGADSNVAVGLARLGHRVGWVSRLGRDAFGRYVRTVLHAEGVDVSRVAEDATRSTGIMLKGRSEDGSDPAVEYYRRGSAASALSLADFDAAYFTGARHLHVTGIVPALSAGAAELVEHAMRRMREAGRTISFDPNLRPTLWPDEATMRTHLNRLAAAADWVLPGLAEGRRLTGADTPEAVAEAYLALGARAVVVKLGEAGSFVRTADGASHQVGGVAVPTVVDTVGAGDGFAAGLISARLEGHDWPRALARGNWVGAQVIQRVGDIDGLPRRSALPPDR